MPRLTSSSSTSAAPPRSPETSRSLGALCSTCTHGRRLHSQANPVGSVTWIVIYTCTSSPCSKVPMLLPERDAVFEVFAGAFTLNPDEGWGSYLHTWQQRVACCQAQGQLCSSGRAQAAAESLGRASPEQSCIAHVSRSEELLTSSRKGRTRNKSLVGVSVCVIGVLGHPGSG